MPGRNDPCHCGSGKKYKKCCLMKIVDYGLCNGPAGGPGTHFTSGMCGMPGSGVLECKRCHKRYTHCRDHHGEVVQMMQGHVARMHPELIPTEKFDLLLDDPEELARIRAEWERSPDLWQRMMDYIAERQRTRQQEQN
jgi:hypothetical protein